MLTTSHTTADSEDTAQLPQIRTHVVDTSVLLSDPLAMLRFAEHNVVLPLVVITELEAKRHHPELGYFARSALRLLDELRVKHGRLDAPMPINDEGGNLRVELNHTDQTSLPAGFRLDDNDTRILAVALNYANEGHDVVLVSKDLPLRVKAAAVGLAAEEYRNEQPLEAGWSGMAEIDWVTARLRPPKSCPRTAVSSRRAPVPRRWPASFPMARFASSATIARCLASVAAPPSNASP